MGLMIPVLKYSTCGESKYYQQGGEAVWRYVPIRRQMPSMISSSVLDYSRYPSFGPNNILGDGWSGEDVCMVLPVHVKLNMSVIFWTCSC